MEKCQSEEQSFCTLQPDGNILNSEILKRSQGTDLSSSCLQNGTKKKSFQWKKSKTHSQEE